MTDEAVVPPTTTTCDGPLLGGKMLAVKRFFRLTEKINCFNPMSNVTNCFV